ncbi:SpoIIE family protein phosphatase [Goekera deserti]|uniref:SpoIIE family protein phosphatase n=1 Tax=Goekera deserti TaxID=2497753 RepID=UPI001391AC38|nr:SpoIIE family protein phosphatase [Goekera deserti]
MVAVGDGDGPDDVPRGGRPVRSQDDRPHGDGAHGRAHDDRRHQVHGLHVALSAAGTLAEVAGVVSSGLRTILGASVVSVCTAGTDGLLHTVDVAGYPVERLRAFATIPMSAPLPLTDAARTRTPVWCSDRAAVVAGYPAIAGSLLPGTQALASLPLLVADRLIGALGVTFLEPMPFDPAERSFLVAIAGQVATAVERAGLADAHREMAETLQRSLLPGAVPALDGVAVAVRYLPAVAGTRAGGDWYDVLDLGGGAVAVAVGDVVGHGAAAAAVMGQLRSSLTTLLLAGFGPARALELLDRFADRVPGAGVATAACVLIDRHSGRLTWASAGHPPPLVVGAGGGTFLRDGAGPALGVAVTRPRHEAGAHLETGATLLLYTDGLVETQGESVDEGLVRLADVATGRRSAPVAELADGLLAALVDPAGAADDVAVVALRLLPAPLRLEVPASPAVLSRVRREAGAWAAAAGVPPEAVEDLQLALGEAAGNAAEHAYRDAATAGPLGVALDLEPDGGVGVRVSDAGDWRPAPDDPGHRGRGLQMISALARDVDVSTGPAGTTVAFRLPPPVVPPARPARSSATAAERPATVAVTRQAGATHVAVAGDLDQAGVAAVGATLLAEADRGGPLVVDVTGLGWLTSVGIGLLLQVARRAGGRATFRLPPSGPARRVVELTGVAAALSRDGDAAGRASGAAPTP